MTIRKAERKRAKLRLGMASPAGGGKTYSALLLAFGLGGKVGMIDTERGSGDLYAHLGTYDIIGINAPYTVKKYLDAIKEFESAGYDTIIIDSLSHAWAGDGGLLDKQGKIADKSGNSYTAWRQVTPEHNSLVDAMLQSQCHIIATMRSKTEYIQEKNDQGRQVVRKVGLAPVQREGMDFEMSVMLDLDINHIASVSKDRTGLFDGQYFKITSDTGRQLLLWLETGTEAQAAPTQSANAEAVVEVPRGEQIPTDLSFGLDIPPWLIDIESDMDGVKHNSGEPLKALANLQTIFGPAYMKANRGERLWLQSSYNDNKRRLIEDGLRAFTDQQALKGFKDDVLLKTGDGDHGWILAEYEVCQDALRKIRAGATAVDMPETSQV